MVIKHECLECGYQVLSDEELAGQTIACPGCRREVVVPRPLRQLNVASRRGAGPIAIGAIVGVVIIAVLLARSGDSPDPTPTDDTPTAPTKPTSKPTKVPPVAVGSSAPEVPPELPDLPSDDDSLDPATAIDASRVAELADWLRTTPFTVSAAIEHGVLRTPHGPDQAVLAELHTRLRVMGMHKFRSPRGRLRFVLVAASLPPLRTSAEAWCRLAIALERAVTALGDAPLEPALQARVAAHLDRMEQLATDVRGTLVAYRLHLTAQHPVPPAVAAAALRVALLPGSTHAKAVEDVLTRNGPAEAQAWLPVIKGVSETQRDSVLEAWFGASDGDWQIERVLEHPSLELRLAIAIKLAETRDELAHERAIDILTGAARQGDRTALVALPRTTVPDTVLSPILLTHFQTSGDWKTPVLAAVRSNPRRTHATLVKSLSGLCLDPTEGPRYFELIVALGPHGWDLLFDLAKNKPFDPQVWQQLRVVPAELSAEHAGWLVKRLDQGDREQRLLAACALAHRDAPLALEAVPLVSAAFDRLCAGQAAPDDAEWSVVAQAMMMLIRHKADSDFAIEAIKKVYVDSTVGNRADRFGIDALLRAQPEDFQRTVSRALATQGNLTLRQLGIRALQFLRDVDGLAKLTVDPDPDVASKAMTTIKLVDSVRYDALCVENLASPTLTVAAVALMMCSPEVLARNQPQVQTVIDAMVVTAPKTQAAYFVHVLTAKIPELPTNDDTCAWACKLFVKAGEDAHERLLVTRIAAMTACASLPKHFMVAMRTGLKHRSFSKRMNSALCISYALGSGITLTTADLNALEANLTECLAAEKDGELRGQLSGPIGVAKSKVEAKKKKK